MSKTNEVVTDTLALFEGLYEQLSKTFSKNASAAKETLSREIQIAQAKKERRKLIIELGEKSCYDTANGMTPIAIMKKNATGR